LGKIISVSKKHGHHFSKLQCASIQLIKGQGVEGDAHRGITVKHLSRVKIDPTQPNLRQVHLIHYELIEELQNKGFKVDSATLGENITTKGIDLLSLPKGAKLLLGNEAVIEITGLRNPCKQLDQYQSGLTKAVLDKDSQGNLIRKAGIMAIVLKGGEVSIGDSIQIELPAKPYQPLERV